MNAISGRKRGELFLRWDPNGSCWRTYQLCFTVMDETGQPMGGLFSETLPKWATISNMELRVLPMPEPPISGNGSGSWPTPRVSDTEGGAVKNVEFENGSFSRKNADGTRWGVKLRDAVESGKWPTPRRSEYKGCGPYGSKSYKHMLDRDYLSPAVLAPDNSGILSPDWTAWLMGLPQNWVTLEPVSEESFAEWETRMADGSWWEDEHDLPRTVPSRKGRVDMLKALGNGIVPRTIPTFLNYARSN